MCATPCPPLGGPDAGGTSAAAGSALGSRGRRGVPDRNFVRGMLGWLRAKGGRGRGLTSANAELQRAHASIFGIGQGSHRRAGGHVREHRHGAQPRQGGRGGHWLAEPIPYRRATLRSQPARVCASCWRNPRRDLANGQLGHKPCRTVLSQRQHDGRIHARPAQALPGQQVRFGRQSVRTSGQQRQSLALATIAGMRQRTADGAMAVTELKTREPRVRPYLIRRTSSR